MFRNTAIVVGLGAATAIGLSLLEVDATLVVGSTAAVVLGSNLLFHGRFVMLFILLIATALVVIFAMGYVHLYEAYGARQVKLEEQLYELKQFACGDGLVDIDCDALMSAFDCGNTSDGEVVPCEELKCLASENKFNPPCWGSQMLDDETGCCVRDPEKESWWEKKLRRLRENPVVMVGESLIRDEEVQMAIIAAFTQMLIYNSIITANVALGTDAAKYSKTTKSGKTSTKWAAKAGTKLRTLGKKAATLGQAAAGRLSTKFGRAMVRRVTTKMAVQVGKRVATRVGTAAARFATNAMLKVTTTGPIGVVLVILDVLSLIVDILDPLGYDKFVEAKSLIMYRDSLEALMEIQTEALGLDYPQLFPLVNMLPMHVRWASAEVNAQMQIEILDWLATEGELVEFDGLMLTLLEEMLEEEATGESSGGATLDAITAEADVLAGKFADYFQRDFERRDQLYYEFLQMLLTSRGEHEFKAYIQRYPDFVTASRSSVSLSKLGVEQWMGMHWKNWISRPYPTPACEDPEKGPTNSECKGWLTKEENEAFWNKNQAGAKMERFHISPDSMLGGVFDPNGNFGPSAIFYTTRWGKKNAQNPTNDDGGVNMLQYQYKEPIPMMQYRGGTLFQYCWTQPSQDTMTEMFAKLSDPDSTFTTSVSRGQFNLGIDWENRICMYTAGYCEDRFQMEQVVTEIKHDCADADQSHMDKIPGVTCVSKELINDCDSPPAQGFFEAVVGKTITRSIVLVGQSIDAAVGGSSKNFSISCDQTVDFWTNAYSGKEDGQPWQPPCSRGWL